MDYQSFLGSKRIVSSPSGHAPGALNGKLFPFQRDITAWAVRRGKAALFMDCGLGKSFCQLEWARCVHEHTGGDVLILAPLAVAGQTHREGIKFGIDVTVCRTQEDVLPGINVTNYEKLHHFDPRHFSGIVLDESSILKAHTGKTRTAIIESFSSTPYRLACTATPAPNDYMEIGNHTEFLGLLSHTEMLSTFFVHDGGDTSKWRLKRHAEADYWKWLCSWAVMIRKPSDLGYEDDGFILPPMRVHEHVVSVDRPSSGFLIPVEAQTLRERQIARKETTDDRVAATAGLANSSEAQWLIWCDLNDESAKLTRAIRGAVEVKGSDTEEHKEQAVLDFVSGKVRCLVTKPSISGWGVNLQNCSKMAFVGLSDSWEAWYQAVRRCWRFGQKETVDVHVITASTEGAVVRNIQRKEAAANKMAEEMVAYMADISSVEIRGTAREPVAYERDMASGDGWDLHLGDCVDVFRELQSESVGYSIFSPPFASLYTYTASERDMGNCRDYKDFGWHFAYLVRELFRVTKPGRNLSFHCMQLPISKEREGYIGIRDFRGILIRMFQRVGWIYHSEVVIWKDPVTAMQRTKALGLLWKQVKKDSTLSRQGIADYVVTMRKPGLNPEPVGHKPEQFPVDLWQKYASPVWMDINPSCTLQRESAREEEDERHICPLQLEVIERCVMLWSNPGDLVASPFAGIGSEGYQALKMGRRFVGAELKRSYWEQAKINLANAARPKQQSLF